MSVDRTCRAISRRKADFNRLTIPDGLHDMHRPVAAAVQLHSDYYADRAGRAARNERFRFSVSDQRIKASGRQLIHATGSL